MTVLDFINKLDEMLEDAAFNCGYDEFNEEVIKKVKEEYEKEEEERFYKNLRI